MAIDMPHSWVPKLSVPRDMVDMRVPKGTKRVTYRFSEHELYAYFGECSRDWDGMVEKLTIFTDEDHKEFLEVCKFFLSACWPGTAVWHQGCLLAESVPILVWMVSCM